MEEIVQEVILKRWLNWFESVCRMNETHIPKWYMSRNWTLKANALETEHTLDFEES